MAAMLLLLRLLMNVVLVYPLADGTATPPVVSPKNLSNMGSATQVAQPGAKLVPPLAAKLAFALLNSCRKPFSKMLISLMWNARQLFGTLFPVYRISSAVSLNISRSIPKLYWWTYGVRILGSTVQRPFWKLERKFLLSVTGITNGSKINGTPPAPSTPSKFALLPPVPSVERL